MILDSDHQETISTKHIIEGTVANEPSEPHDQSLSQSPFGSAGECPERFWDNGMK